MTDLNQHITKEMLEATGTCASGLVEFETRFGPHGAPANEVLTFARSVVGVWGNSARDYVEAAERAIIAFIDPLYVTTLTIPILRATEYMVRSDSGTTVYQSLEEATAASNILISEHTLNNGDASITYMVDVPNGDACATIDTTYTDIVSDAYGSGATYYVFSKINGVHVRCATIDEVRIARDFALDVYRQHIAQTYSVAIVEKYDY